MTKPDLRTVVCVRGPLSLPGARVVTTGGTAKDVDITHPQVADAIEQGALEVAAKAPRKGRHTSDKEEGA
jgi:hypothetical protein